MRVEVDYDKCQSLGVCESLAPHIFEVRADGLMHVLKEELSPEDVSAVEDAVVACPSFALRLVREG
jgi:ferredoxin